MNTLPTTDREWTIHSLNIHGTFFERLCQKVVAETPGWQVKQSNFPVEYPPPNAVLRGKESNLDVWAQYMRNDSLLTIPIECKKNNPEYTDWIFFRKQTSLPYEISLHAIQNIPNLTPAIGWRTQTEMRSISLDKSLIVADEAREVKGQYQKIKDEKNKTKTANTSITEATYQVALATQAIYSEEGRSIQAMGQHDQPLTYTKHLLIPMVVTTAKLSVCSFDAKDVDLASGVIPFDKVELTEQPFLIYEYPLPRSLQLTFDIDHSSYAPHERMLKMSSRMYVFIVHSTALSDTLNVLANSFA